MQTEFTDLISIIVPVYNVEKYLRKCIDSIIIQTYTNLEIILIDDGSSDNSGNICEEYKKQDSRIHVIHKENGGLSSARNVGIDNATGQFISFVDSDDYLRKDMIEVLYLELKKWDADLCISPMQKVDEDGKYLFTEQSDVEGLISKEEALRKLAFGWTGFPMVGCGKLAKLELYKGLYFKEGKIHEDEFMFHHLLDRCDKIIQLKIPYYFYLQRKGSIVNSQISIKRFDCVEAKIERAILYIEKNMNNEAIAVLHSAASYFCSCYERMKSFNSEEKERVKFLKDAIKDAFKKTSFSIKELKRRCYLRLFISHFKIYRYLFKKYRLDNNANRYC